MFSAVILHHGVLHLMLAVPVVHKETAGEGEQQQDDRGAQLELFIFVFVGKSKGDVTSPGQKVCR